MKRNRIEDYILEYGFTSLGTEGPFHIMKMTSEDGYGIIKALNLLEGITISYNDLHMKTLYKEPPVPFPYLGINHCSQGTYEVTLKNDKICFLKEGDICLSNLYLDDMVYTRIPSGTYSGISIMIELDLAQKSIEKVAPYLNLSLNDLVDKLTQNRSVVLMHPKIATERILQGMYDINEAILKPYLITKVIELLLYLDTEFSESIYNVPQFSPSVVSRTKEVCSYISSNVGEKHTSKALAKHFHLAETSLRECFKAIYGQPLASYLRSIRIDKALHLIDENPTLSIRAIAEECGYENQSKFASAFRQALGSSPLEYKNKKLSQK